MKAIHPGAVLRQVLMRACSPALTEADVARRTGLPEETIRLLLQEGLDITDSLAQHLAALPTTTAEYWRGLQHTYNVQVRNDRSLNGVASHSSPISWKN
jgi:plasmid maintenance system antidote protein VapI